MKKINWDVLIVYALLLLGAAVLFASTIKLAGEIIDQFK